MYAGVPALVVSLWSVNDLSTSQIMQFFYQYLAEGRDKAEALRQAKLDYLQRSKGISAHPAYWSAFVQMGDSRAVVLKQKGGGWWWLLLASATAVGIGLALRQRGKE